MDDVAEDRVTDARADVLASATIAAGSLEAEIECPAGPKLEACAVEREPFTT
ncbi:MAG: hypothetical protein ACREM3_15490 [Candidatus Rokuibacteriota bacterium]